ncbi:MAG: NifB/NifX family molybdenum-iron cluster-binding protein [Candidatus Andersenbacteria bacterium]|nr:NifB/NifX family molybdenum-iron cluster-binding protein [Candidatus Andersenbacteria bacterium]
MKIAISSKEKDLNGEVDSVFGRCPYFLIVEIEDKKIQGFEAIENTSAEQAGGAGISTAQAVAEKDVDAIITGNIGPRALDVLGQFNIKIYNGSGSIDDVLRKFIDGKLETI